MGTSIFNPYRIDLLNQSLRNLTDEITSVTTTPFQIWCKSSNGGFLRNARNITNFMIDSTFLGTHLQVRPVGGFSHLMAQSTRTHTRMCFVDIAPHLWGQIVKKPNF